MVTVSINITVTDVDVAADILDRIATEIKDGYTTGMARNDDGRYSYELSSSET